MHIIITGFQLPIATATANRDRNAILLQLNAYIDAARLHSFPSSGSLNCHSNDRPPSIRRWMNVCLGIRGREVR